MGAILGAIRCGLPWKVVDRYRASDVSDQADWTLMDAHVRRLEIYGSGGWVFESPRARKTEPLLRRGFDLYVFSGNT